MMRTAALIIELDQKVIHLVLKTVFEATHIIDSTAFMIRVPVLILRTAILIIFSWGHPHHRDAHLDGC